MYHEDPIFAGAKIPAAENSPPGCFLHAASNPQSNYTPKPKPVVRKTESFVGKFVTHDELGAGVVIEDKGDILTIAFKTRGIKKVAREYVKV